jgi:hypothetical protein
MMFDPDDDNDDPEKEGKENPRHPLPPARGITTTERAPQSEDEQTHLGWLDGLEGGKKEENKE